jgi:putative transposase
VLERLDFRGRGLSRRLNRLLTNCGRAGLRATLKDLEERYGITAEEVNPAYSSQTCSNPDCGSVDRRNRKSQSRFVCGGGGLEVQADVNGSRNLEAGRSGFDRGLRVSKETALQMTVMRHLERMGAAKEGALLEISLWPPRTRDRVISGTGVHVANPSFRDALQGLWPETDSDTTGGPRKPRTTRQAAIRRARQINPYLGADVSKG